MAGSGSSNGIGFLLGGVGTKLLYPAGSAEGVAGRAAGGMSLGDVVVSTCADGSPDVSWDSLRESTPGAAGDARSGAPGPSLGLPNVRNVEGDVVTAA